MSRRGRPPADGRGYLDSVACKALGCSRSTLDRWRRAGYVVDTPDRTAADVAATQSRVAANNNPLQGGRTDRGVGGAATSAAAIAPFVQSPASPHVPGVPGNHNQDYLAAKARSEAARAQLTELKIAERIGELLPRAAAEQVYLDLLASKRSALEAIPVRLCNQLVGLDAGTIRTMLQSEIAEALSATSGVAEVEDGQ